LSQQDIHGRGVTLESLDSGSVTLKPAKGKSRKLITTKTQMYRGQALAALASLRVGEKVYVQSAGDSVRLILDPAAFAARQAAQKATLRKRWTEEGLPGTVAFLHIFSGEMVLMLDHEAMRWGRTLKLGDKVTLQALPPIPAVVKQVRPWR